MSILTKQKQILHRFFHFSKQLTILDQSSNGNSLISKLCFFMPLAGQTSKLLSLCRKQISFARLRAIHLTMDADSNYVGNIKYFPNDPAALRNLGMIHYKAT